MTVNFEIQERQSDQTDLTPSNATVIFPAQGGEDSPDAAPCPTCSGTGAPPAYVYAIGKIEPRFPQLSVEKELAQVAGRSDTAGLTDHETLHSVLSQPQNRYLLKKLCWVFTIEGLETYLLQVRDTADLDLLLEALRPTPHLHDVDVIIGLRGPIAPAGFCNGLMLPIIVLTQVYSFDVASLLTAIPRPPEIEEQAFSKTTEEVFTRIMQMADNAGATDEHRALNYLALRYHAIYAKAFECHQESCTLTGIEVRPSRLSGTRNILDVIFSYTNRRTDVVEKYFVRVDVTEEFPFLVTKLSPYFDR
jgi:PatG C-terminal